MAHSKSGFVASGRLGVASPSGPARQVSAARLGVCPDDCPAGYRRVFGQCILDVPPGVVLLAGRSGMRRR